MRKTIVSVSSLVLGFTFLFSPTTQAAKFANQFAEFELPAQWSCTLENAEWVCQSTDKAKKKEAIIILAAKLRGDQDSLDKYLDYLKNPKSYTSIQGKQVRSEVRFAKTEDINGQAWIRSQHLESELPSFYTVYFATIKEDIGVVITFSVNKDKYQQYASDIETLVKTLRVFRKPGGLNAQSANSNAFNNVSIPQGINESAIFPGGATDVAKPAAPKKKDRTDLILYGVIAAAAIFFILKKRKG